MSLFGARNLVTLLSAVFVLAACDSGPSGEFAANRFDSEKWKTDKQARYAMSKHVVFDEIHSGTSKKEVLAKLGPPDKKVPAQLNMEYWYYNCPYPKENCFPKVDILMNGDIVSQTGMDFVGDEGNVAAEETGI